MAQYPARWEADVVVSDGGVVHVRPIRPDDGDHLRALHQRLSTETIYLRFFSPIPTLSNAMVERFTHVDYVDRLALVAQLDDDIIGVARYDRLPEPRHDQAEVAFVIDDAHQGRGLGTLLLEHLAAAARENGVAEFVAETLPGNNRMLRVFRDAGFGDERRLADGVVSVRFPISPTEASVAAMHDRERVAAARSVSRLLAPRSVAVVGAGRERGNMGHEVVRTLLQGSFAGAVYAVHPSAYAVAGVRAYPSVLDVPDHVDVAVIAVPAASVPEVVEQCGAKRVGGLVVLSAGFADAGPEGAAVERRLVERGRALGMRMIGPNCMGVVNTAPDVSMNATFAPVTPVPGRVGFLSQSGALGMAILDELGRRGLGVSTFVSVGNKADVSGNDLVQYWEDDDATDMVLLYLESFGNPRTFSRVARRVARRKPILAVKSGRRETSELAVEALFRQTGVIRADTLEQLFDVAVALATQPLPAGRRIGIVGNAGGPVRLAVDAAEGAGLVVQSLTHLASEAGPGDYSSALRGLLGDAEVDGVIVSFVPPLEDVTAKVASAVAEAGAGCGKPVLANFMVAGPGPGGGSGSVVAGLPTYLFPEAAAIAFARLVERAEWLAEPEGAVVELPDLDVVGARMLVDKALADSPEGVWLDGGAVQDVLACYGIRVGGPGGEGVDTTVAVSQHESFGPVVRLSIGGAELSELVGDHAARILPLTTVDATTLVRSLKSSPLLFGWRGSPVVDVGALEDLLLRVSALVEDLPHVAELVLDPVVVAPVGATPAGARVRLAPYEPRPELAMRRLR